jgi:protein gp37
MKYWDKAWSIIEQCTPVSEACTNCWLKAIDNRFGRSWNGEVKCRPDRLDIPLRIRKPTVFAVWSDLFHEAVPYEFIHKAYGVMLRCPQHTFLILTKRPRRMAEYWSLNTIHALIRYEVLSLKAGRYNGTQWPLSDIWHGTTCENQKAADEEGIL